MQQVLVTLEDDLDGSPATETVRFGLGRLEYEIDLNGKHAERLRKTVGAYADCGRKTGPLRGPVRSAARRRHAAAIRAWAKEQGHKLGEKGRIPGWIEDEYDKVHGT